MNTHLSEALDGVEIMKGAAQEGAETETFVTNARRVRDAFVRQGDIEARFLPNLLIGLAYAGGLFHALLLFRARSPQHGRGRGLLRPAAHAGIPHFHLLLCLHTDLARAFRRAPHPGADEPARPTLDQNAAGRTAPMRGEIEFRDVSFAYPHPLICRQLPPCPECPSA